MAEVLLKDGDQIVLPVQMKTIETIIYDKGPVQQIKALANQTIKSHGKPLCVVKDVTDFMATCQYIKADKVQGKGVVQIIVDPSFTSTTKGTLKGQKMVLIKGTFKVKLTKNLPAKSPPPVNMPDPPSLGQGEGNFISVGPPTIKGT